MLLIVIFVYGLVGGALFAWCAAELDYRGRFVWRPWPEILKSALISIAYPFLIVVGGGFWLAENAIALLVKLLLALSSLRIDERDVTGYEEDVQSGRYSPDGGESGI